MTEIIIIDKSAGSAKFVQDEFKKNMQIHVRPF